LGLQEPTPALESGWKGSGAEKKKRAQKKKRKKDWKKQKDKNELRGQHVPDVFEAIFAFGEELRRGIASPERGAGLASLASLAEGRVGL
jgi:hypothetical protein